MKQDFLSELNAAQRQAVEKIYGPVLVLAGPGTGKTHLLTNRILHILQATDADASNILCLTFTETAAAEMRNRLLTRMGSDAYRVKICTFHGFCEWVMKELPARFERIRGSREVADDLARALAFRDAIRSRKWEYFSDVWNEFFSQRDVLKAISQLKRENISLDHFRKLIPEEKARMEADPNNFYKRKFGTYKSGDEKPAARERITRTIGKLSELAELWEVLEQKMRERNAFDFDDQLMWVVTELQKNEALRADLRERFQWILVDEYQDTNSAQNEILWQITSFDEEPNLFAVGDDDQSIYRFQGASAENMREFQKRFPTHTLITLTENYRSAPNILSSASHIIAHNLDRINSEKKLIASGANKNFSGEIARGVFGSRYAELSFLVHQIRQEISNGTLSSEIAILVRRNSEVEEIARTLLRFGIPVAAQLFQNIFDDSCIRVLILMLEIFADPANDEKLFELLAAPHWHISAEKLLALSHERDMKKKPALDFLLEKAKEDAEVSQVTELVATSRKNFFHCRPEVLCEKLLYESGLATYLSREKNEEAAADWARMHKFLELVRDQKLETLPELLDRLNLYRQLYIPVRPDPLPADRRAIQILTAHGAKGREFDIVFMPGILDTVWGNTRNRNGIVLPHIFKDEHDENEDERRLFFVALTRARKKIFLSYSSQDASGKERTPSQFLTELPLQFFHDLPSDAIEEEMQKLLPVFLQTTGKNLLTSGEKEILKERVKNFVWSATSLQDMLDCPRKFLFKSLYRLPRKPTPKMAFGTALHEALERFLRPIPTLGKVNLDAQILLQEFDRSLRGQNLPLEEFQKLLAHGQEILKKYFTHKKEQFPQNSLFEFQFGQFAPHVDEIRITGKMDRIDFLNPEKTQARIVDYKSGKARSIKKGERLWRQLVFYDLLARNSHRILWRVQSCELEFLTPDNTGKFSTRALEVSEKDRAQVISELHEVHEKLQNLEFPLVPNPKNDEEIEYWQNFGK